MVTAWNLDEKARQLVHGHRRAALHQTGLEGQFSGGGEQRLRDVVD